MKWFKWYPPNPNVLKVECEKHCWHEIAPQGAYDPSTYQCCACGRPRIKVLPPIPEGHGGFTPRNYEYEP